MIKTILLTVVSTFAILASIGGTIQTPSASASPVVLDGHKHGVQAQGLPEMTDVDVQALGNDVYTIALYVDGVEGPAYIFEMAGDNSKATSP